MLKAQQFDPQLKDKLLTHNYLKTEILIKSQFLQFIVKVTIYKFYKYMYSKLRVKRCQHQYLN